MIRFAVLVLVACSSKSAAPELGSGSGSAPPPMDAKAREAAFVKVPTSDGIAATIGALSAEPHVAGTPGALRSADRLAAMLGPLGFAVETAEYQVYLPHPTKLSIAIRGGPTLVTVEEPGGRKIDAGAFELMTWNTYGVAGKVSAPVVFADTGSAADFAALAKAGVDPKGKVVLLRYGPLYRGAQVASAEKHGAAAVILYPDPKDEPERSPTSVQRGTVTYYWQYTGDPLTPGVAATADAKRLAVKDAEVLPKIPVANVSATEAGKLKDKLVKGVGPVVEIELAVDDKPKTIRNVIAKLPGATDELVVLGNHHDAWVFGALDPHSGSAVLIEIAKAFGALAKTGWKPRRTIAIAFWDAEEPGVIGSTEWVEQHEKELRDRAVAYFNIDTIKAGALTVQGAPQLRAFVTECAGTVQDPLTGKPFAPAFKDIGIGSDWTAFLHHAGVPSMQWQTGAGKGKYTTWHSIGDDLEAARTLSDPGFAFFPAYAKAMGTCALRLADAERLPMRYSATIAWIQTALDAFAKSTKLSLARAKLDPALVRLAALTKEIEGSNKPCSLIGVERTFLTDSGIPGRPWYRHAITGPEPSNGYGALPLPELAGARDQAALDTAVDRLATILAATEQLLASCK